jgi:hypothetical protein
MYEVDWLRRLEYEAWSRRIRQLCWELSNEKRIQLQQPQPSAQEVAPPPQPERSSKPVRPIPISNYSKDGN